MSATEKQIRMAADLYEARDAMRAILGDKFARRMKETGDYIDRIAAARGVSQMAAGIGLARSRQGMDAVLVLAAVVELVEPTPTTQDPAQLVKLARRHAAAAVSSAVDPIAAKPTQP